MKAMRKLTPDEITTLKNHNCSAENWDWIQVAPDFDAQRIQSTRFYGRNSIGNNTGHVQIDGIDRPCGIYGAVLKNCRIGDQVFIANVSSGIQNYTIADQVVIEDVHQIMTEGKSRFGNGVRVNSLNEGGGRKVTLFDDLNAQVAFLQAIYKQDDRFQANLEKLINLAVEDKSRAHGTIACAAVIRGCKTIKNVNIGPFSVITGASELSDGTIASCREDPTIIGSNVIMRNFIVSEGAQVHEGSALEHVFIGQGVRVGKNFSAEHSLFFANCEMFHSEACSIFAGPYTVTHHRSTLLIACMFSFYNAGSGSNQSNHMYKLGPVHQGILERGCKTGSFSYLLLESHVPAFSVVIGKHMSNINVPDLPFSYISEDASRSHLIPGKNLFSIGTVRDGAKWPARDRRKSSVKRDLIVFDVFSPYTVEKMRRGRDTLQELYDNAAKEQEAVHHGGVVIKRLLLRKGAKYYGMAVDRYLLGKVFEKIEEPAEETRWDKIAAQLQPATIQHPACWVDLAGLLALRERIDAVIRSVAEDKIETLDGLSAELEKIFRDYKMDEWAYVCHAFEQEYGCAPQALDKEKMSALIARWQEAAGALNALTLADAQSEFADYARIGYGLGAVEEERLKDFEAVRGSVATNEIIQQCQAEGEAIKDRAARLLELVKRF
ncbi:DUF4954 family protein [candidate division KSB1 bacterium]|nr:DUF4954 family protein [candidate division KSB1 bacterium]